MICNNCGNMVPDGQYTCNVCGSYVGTQQAQPTYQQPQQNVQQGQYYGNANTYQNMMKQPDTYEMKSYGPALGMKWYKFVIYFMLFLSAILTLRNGIIIITGAHYDSAAGYKGASELIYKYYDGLKALDVMMGLACFAMAVYAIVVRFALAGYKKNGPKMFIAMYVISIAVNGLYALAASNITALAFSDIYNPVSIVISLLMIWANTVYFRKREHLFVN